MAITKEISNNVSEFLYHVKATMIDFAGDNSGATRGTNIMGTYIDLPTAKAAACSTLFDHGYRKDDFVEYEVKDNSNNEEWKYGDGVIAFAQTPAGHEFKVSIDTKPNSLGLKGNSEGKVDGPLYYVLQRIIDYNKDATGAEQSTEIEGTYITRKEAYEAAKTALLDEDITKGSFAEYEERTDPAEKGEWPYGDDVWVHALAETGENFDIAVKTQPPSHSMHTNESSVHAVEGEQKDRSVGSWL